MSTATKWLPLGGGADHKMAATGHEAMHAPRKILSTGEKGAILKIYRERGARDYNITLLWQLPTKQCYFNLRSQSALHWPVRNHAAKQSHLAAPPTFWKCLVCPRAPVWGPLVYHRGQPEWMRINTPNLAKDHCVLESGRCILGKISNGPWRANWRPAMNKQTCLPMVTAEARQLVLV